MTGTQASRLQRGFRGVDPSWHANYFKQKFELERFCPNIATQ